MRTTISIDDRLLALAKERAHQRRLTLGQVIEDALQRALVSPGGPAATPELAVIPGRGGLRPGVDPRSNASLFDAMDDPRA